MCDAFQSIDIDIQCLLSVIFVWYRFEWFEVLFLRFYPINSQEGILIVIVGGVISFYSEENVEGISTCFSQGFQQSNENIWGFNKS